MFFSCAALTSWVMSRYSLTGGIKSVCKTQTHGIHPKQMLKIPQNCRFASCFKQRWMPVPIVWMSVVEEEREPSFEVELNLGQMFPSLNPAVHPLPSSCSSYPPTHQQLYPPPTPHIYFSGNVPLPYNHFLHPSITLEDYITFRHSSRRRGGAARIDPLPLTWTGCQCHSHRLSFRSL